MVIGVVLRLGDGAEHDALGSGDSDVPMLLPGGLLGVVPQLHHLPCLAESSDQGSDASGVVVPAPSIHVGAVVDDERGVANAVLRVENVLVSGSAGHDVSWLVGKRLEKDCLFRERIENLFCEEEG